MAAGTPGDVEFDLEAPDPAPPPRPAPGRRSRLFWAAGGLALGLLLGDARLPAGDPGQPVAPAPAPPVRVALGAYAADAGDEVVAGPRTVSVPVPAVVVNETSGPLVVRYLQVSGPGARLAPYDFGMTVTFPLHLPPGEAVAMPFGLASDCAVRIRPLPRITVVVGRDDGSADRPVDVLIPDLGALWGRTLDPSLCRA